MTIEYTIKYILQHVLELRSTDNLVIVTGNKVWKIAERFFKISRLFTTNICVCVIPPLTEEYPEPASPVHAALENCTVFVGITSIESKSITHTEARRRACATGARGITMPGITPKLLLRPSLVANYQHIAAATMALANRLNGVEQIHLTSAAGTDAWFDVRGGQWFAEKGLCSHPGEFSNLPGGEVSISPVNCEGRLVIDTSFGGLGRLHRPLVLEIKNRYITNIQGSLTDCKKLEKKLFSHGDCAFNVAEIGIGMNLKARICGNILEDEKVLGTVHVGFGDNANMGGETRGEIVHCSVHLDGVIARNPQIIADGEKVFPEAFFQSL
ncbi:MAG: hypothetical protein QXI12_06135 [Candidatus Methanomethyliaceae archaeon]